MKNISLINVCARVREKRENMELITESEEYFSDT